jgi:hypothetical protein
MYDRQTSRRFTTFLAARQRAVREYHEHSSLLESGDRNDVDPVFLQDTQEHPCWRKGDNFGASEPHNNTPPDELRHQAAEPQKDPAETEHLGEQMGVEGEIGSPGKVYHQVLESDGYGLNQEK